MSTYQKDKITLLHGDCLDMMKLMDDNSVDSIVTDPPYGLSFMGKKWDYNVPSAEIWREALRVLKPGGHLLSFGGTRTYHRMAVNIEDAGFEIRDQIQWLYGSGFPKSHNIKEGEFKGWGTALKPANEPICLARKPLEKGLTIAENVMKWGTGVLNIDGCRVVMKEGDTSSSLRPCRMRQDLTEKKDAIFGSENDSYKNNTTGATQGRWPANIILDEVAAEALDEQSGTLKSGAMKHVSSKSLGYRGNGSGAEWDHNASSGGASRFFYVAKASKRERNAGLEGILKRKTNDGRLKDADNAYQRGTSERLNHHPTVKPTKLMEYLIKLITPPNGIVMDPFMGSGSTGVAANTLGFEFIGFEMNEEYFEIAVKRISNPKIAKVG